MTTFTELVQAIYVGVAVLSNTPPEDAECMLKTIYYESRGESLSGQILVGIVVDKRLRSENYPDTICDVVNEARKPGLFNCQFTAWCDGLKEDPRDFNAIMNAALASILASWSSVMMPNLTHFHSSRVSPTWIDWDRLEFYTQVDRHLFYLEHKK